MRDVFDLWFFLKKWVMNDAVVKEKTGLTITQAIRQAIKIVQSIKKTQTLDGLGELLGPKQKVWAREKLTGDTVFYLRLSLDALRRSTKQ